MELVLSHCYTALPMVDRLEVKIDLAKLQVVLVQFNLELAHCTFDIQKDLLKVHLVVDKLWKESRRVLLFAKDRIKECFKLFDVPELLLDLLL